MLKQEIVILVILILAMPLKGQNGPYSEKTDEIIEKIEGLNSLFVKHDLTSRAVRIAKKLDGAASHDELLNMLDHHNIFVNCYGFWVLANRDHLDISQIYSVYFALALEEEESPYTDLNIDRGTKACVKTLYFKSNFFYEIYKEGKYLNLW